MSTEVYGKYFVNKSLSTAGISEDDAQGWKSVQKVNSSPRSEACQGNWGILGTIRRGHYPPMYQQTGKRFIYFSTLRLISLGEHSSIVLYILWIFFVFRFNFSFLYNIPVAFLTGCARRGRAASIWKTQHENSGVFRFRFVQKYLTTFDSLSETNSILKMYVCWQPRISSS